MGDEHDRKRFLRKFLFMCDHYILQQQKQISNRERSNEHKASK